MNDNPRLKYDQDQQLIDDENVNEQDKKAARIRQLFWLARYQPIRHSDRLADTFLALWVNLLLEFTAHRWTLPKKKILRNLSQVFDSPKLEAALIAAGSDANDLLFAELKDSARLYFTTCQKDSNYSSLLFNMIKMKDGQIAAKAASGAVDGILVPLLLIGGTPWRDEMIEAICSSYPEVFTENAGLFDENVKALKPEMIEAIARIRFKFLNSRSC